MTTRSRLGWSLLFALLRVVVGVRVGMLSATMDNRRTSRIGSDHA